MGTAHGVAFLAESLRKPNVVSVVVLYRGSEALIYLLFFLLWAVTEGLEFNLEFKP